MKGERLRLAGMVTGILVATCLAPSPAAAVTTTTGGGTFGGAVTLPQFPCSVCTGGTFTGTVALVLQGVGTATMSGAPVPYAAVWPDQTGNAGAGFNFDESCLTDQPPTTPPVEGTADGTFTVGGGQATIGGQALFNVSLSGSLTWLRVGVSARVVLSALTITAVSGGSTVAVNLSNSLDGQSGTAFVWSNGPGTCGSPISNQLALIEGVALQPV